MALTPFGNFSLDWTAKANTISGQASNFKTWLNTRTEDLKTYINDTLKADVDTKETIANVNETRLRMTMGVKFYG